MHPDLQIIAGNVATGAARELLIKAGVNCVKIGIGLVLSVQHVLLQVSKQQITAIMDA